MRLYFVEGRKESGAYLPVSVAARKMGVSKAAMHQHLRSSLYKLGWRQKPPRRPSIPESVRRSLISIAVRTGCGICGHAIVSMERIALDHITPFSVGGTSAPENLRAVHWLCNHTRFTAPEHSEWTEQWGAVPANEAQRMFPGLNRPRPVGFKTEGAH